LGTLKCPYAEMGVQAIITGEGPGKERLRKRLEHHDGMP